MRLFLSILLLTINYSLYSQPEISWIREYDTSSLDESGMSVTETNQHDGYIICGYRNTPVNLQDLFLIRTDLSGDTVWTKQYGVQNGSDYGMKILRTRNGYVIGGMKIKASLAFFAAWLLKIDENGDTLWSKTILDSARIMSVCNMPDGGFSMTGTSGWENTSKAFAARTDSGGNIIWLNYYGIYQNTYGMDIIHSLDNSLIVTGTIFNPPDLVDNLWLLKLNEDGTMASEKVYEIKSIWTKIHQASDGNLYLGVDDFGSIAFLKLDPNGIFLDSLRYTSGIVDMPEIIQSPDSNFICIYSDAFGNGDYSTIIVKKLDQYFNGIWEKVISGNRNFSDVSFIITADNGLLITGRSSEIPSGDNQDILLVRLYGDITPVELIAFNGRNENGRVVLTWETSSETNNSGFMIEKKTASAENSGWVEAGFIEGAGTSSEKHSYSFADAVNTTEILSYRLKQIDFDGSFKYSNEITVKLQHMVFSLSQNYPNPFNPETRINYSIAEEAPVSLNIYNVLGQKISTLVNEIKKPGNYSLDINGSNFASGVYIYQLISGKSVLTRKMLLLK